MSSVINVLLPIFALILLGYVCRRTGRLGPTAASELNRFVVWLGLPSLLFRVVAESHWSQLWQPGFVIAFSAGCLGVFILTVAYRLLQARSLVDASIDALGAAYANTGYIGIPLCSLVFGQAGLQPALIASLLVVCVLFALALICIESGLHRGRGFGHSLRTTALALAKNPLVVAPLLGGLWAATGATMPVPMDRLLELLGEATAPCALVSLGAFLAMEQQGRNDGVWPLVLLKLVVQPAITALLAYKVFHLPAMWAHAALLLAALPTGTGPFMLAEYYRREAAIVSRVILVSTLGALATLSACLYLIG